MFKRNIFLSLTFYLFYYDIYFLKTPLLRNILLMAKGVLVVVLSKLSHSWPLTLLSHNTEQIR